jgi:two-component system, OmpR family, alkaline phosphatase synthesis response regulator PhoP
VARILVVDDEAHIRELVQLHLSFEGHDTVPAADGTTALELARATPFDLFVVDLMLPGLDGVSLVRAIRQQAVSRRSPVLMLTARREEADKVVGLDAGADDYVTKPFGVRELVARVRALLRRSEGHIADATREGRREAHGVAIDSARRLVLVDEVPVETTAQEFSLLEVLVGQPGIVFTRDALLRRIWGTGTHVTDRSVDTLVKRVRQKIERNPADPRRLLTVWGVGYKFRDVSPRGTADDGS